ncbi:MAG: type II secretion system protein [Sedimentisphaerales bacterium]|nr:type II secretion system protein [Sedimentisphaerales bacterium]
MKAFTLVEMLVVISIISLLLAILVPAVNSVKRKAYSLLSMRNQREVAMALDFFAADHRDRYPDSVATVGFGDKWNWHEPTKMTGNRKRTPQVHRSMSAYLHDYIQDAATLHCPGAPQKHKYLQEAWDAGDDWDNPDTAVTGDPFGGTYCFYWNYIGYLSETDSLFRGPSGPASMGRYSRLLLTDYFGYDHWRSPRAFGSCEKLSGAEIVPETQLLSAYWSVPGDPARRPPKVKLHAAYTDGHVETYTPDEAVPLRVSITAEGVPPYPDGTGGGIFYIPRNAVPE